MDKYNLTWLVAVCIFAIILIYKDNKHSINYGRIVFNCKGNRSRFTLLKFRRRNGSASRFCKTVDYTLEMQAIEKQIGRYKRAHPFGPITPEEKREWDNLQYAYAGTLMAMKIDLGLPFDLEKTVSLVEDCEG